MQVLRAEDRDPASRAGREPGSRARHPGPSSAVGVEGQLPQTLPLRPKPSGHAPGRDPHRPFYRMWWNHGPNKTGNGLRTMGLQVTQASKPPLQSKENSHPGLEGQAEPHVLPPQSTVVTGVALRELESREWQPGTLRSDLKVSKREGTHPGDFSMINELKSGQKSGSGSRA